MGSGRILLASLIFVVFASASATAQCQEVNWEGGSIRQGCDETSSSDGDGDDSWWTSAPAQALYALFGLAASGGAFFFGWNRVRRRRRTLRQLLGDAESAYITCKDDPPAGIERLAGIRAELSVRHEHGHVGDSQFMGLDRKIADYIARLRVMELENKFPKLPLELMRDLRTLVEDGHLSGADITRIENRAASLKVAQATRKALVRHLETWGSSNANKPPGQVATVAVNIEA